MSSFSCLCMPASVEKAYSFDTHNPLHLFTRPIYLFRFKRPDAQAEHARPDASVSSRLSHSASAQRTVSSSVFLQHQAHVELSCPLLFTSDAVVMILSGKESRYQGIFSVAYVCI